MHVAIGDTHLGKFADFQMLRLGDDDKTVDLGCITRGASQGAVFVDLIDQHGDFAVDPALEPLGADVFLEFHQARSAFFAHLER